MRGSGLRRDVTRRAVTAAMGALLVTACATGAAPPAAGRPGGLVTVAQWNACTAGGGCPFRLDGAADTPATEVSWDDAQLYLRWLSAREGRAHRLPTLAEWTPAGGEILEWLQDCHPVSDAPPGEPCSHRLVRPLQGSGALSPSLRLTDVGFRVVRNP